MQAITSTTLTVLRLPSIYPFKQKITWGRPVYCYDKIEIISDATNVDKYQNIARFTTCLKSTSLTQAATATSLNLNISPMIGG